LDETLALLTEGPAIRPAKAEAETDGMVGLLSVIVGAGRGSAASHAAARRILRRFASASDLARASVEELHQNGRISRRRAQLVRSALELGRSLCSAPYNPGERFSNSRDLFQRYRPQFYAASKEYFVCLHLNSKNQLIREVLVSVGSLCTSVVHPREVFAPAVRDSAASIILIHNHPSGDPAPSREDRECTHRLFQAGKLLGIRVLDHVILSKC
jgi:DNA repair protein RadC